MTHLKDNTSNELDTILAKLIKNHISYSIRQKDGIIIELYTKNSDLIKFAKSTNPKLINHG